MSSAAVARRYAQALIGAQGGDADGVRTAYAGLIAAYRAEDSLRQAIANPRIKVADKERVLRRLLPDAPQVLQSFLRLLLTRRREAEVEAIYEEYCRMFDERRGEAEAVVETTVPISDEDLERLRTVLEKRFARRLRLTPRVDAGLLGGVRVRVGDQLLDDTVRSRLTSIRRMLLAESELGGQA